MTIDTLDRSLKNAFAVVILATLAALSGRAIGSFAWDKVHEATFAEVNKIEAQNARENEQREFILQVLRERQR
jgi:hypothetical protein